MPMKQQLMEDMKQAMRDRDTVKLGVVRFLMSEIKNYEIDNGEQDDAGVMKIIQKQVKQMKDAISEFEKAGRSDLVEEESQKVAILETYLPQQMSDDELAKIVDEVLTEAAHTQMGPVMAEVMKRVAGQADGGRVSAMVRSKL
ncbi:MAG TPA: GatB/YqeY domain-containing protein [Patescibacteria group bacterium]